MVYGYSCATVAELSGCDRDCMDLEEKNNTPGLHIRSRLPFSISPFLCFPHTKHIRCISRPISIPRCASIFSEFVHIIFLVQEYSSVFHQSIFFLFFFFLFKSASAAHGSCWARGGTGAADEAYTTSTVTLDLSRSCDPRHGFAATLDHQPTE